MKDGCWENIAVVRGQCWDLKPKASAISVVSEKIRVGFNVALVDRSGFVHSNGYAPMDKRYGVG